MNQEKTTLEIIAPSVEEAISRGLNQLGLPRDAVDVEVLDSGSRGLFGIGSRQSRVRLSLKSVPVPAKEEEPAPVQAAEPVQTAQSSVELAQETPSTENLTEEEKKALKITSDVVSELLDKMKVRAMVNTHYLDPAEPGGEKIILADIQGDDLSILIGRRSETLNALQYITSLIVGKELGQWVPLNIDVQGYRTRRERQLRQLAHRMAEQAIHTGRRQSLEPMSAAERRVIHLELRDHPQVGTESVGEEPNRKVTIFLKKS